MLCSRLACKLEISMASKDACSAWASSKPVYASTKPSLSHIAQCPESDRAGRIALTLASKTAGLIVSGVFFCDDEFFVN